MAPTLEAFEPIEFQLSRKPIASSKKAIDVEIKEIHEPFSDNKSAETLRSEKQLKSNVQSTDIDATKANRNIANSSDHDQTTARDPRLVLQHTNVSAEFDDLRFEAAAANQLLPTSSPVPEQEVSPFLISSPYNSPPHLLDLRRLDLPYVLFAQALTSLQPTRSDYATAPYGESLNFDTVLSSLRTLCAQAEYIWTEQIFYLVIFRSVLKPDIDNDYLYQVDAYSHQEATTSGGLLKYWFGKSNAERRNLATCLWRNREDARLGGRGPWHAKARRAARDLYEKINFETHRFVVTDGAREWRIEDWTEG